MILNKDIKDCSKLHKNEFRFSKASKMKSSIQKIFEFQNMYSFKHSKNIKTIEQKND